MGNLRFPIFPMEDGPQITRIGKSRPRKYWEKCWIQLYLEVVSWIDPAVQRNADARLEKLKVVYG